MPSIYTDSIDINLSNVDLYLVNNAEQCLPENKKNLELRLSGSYGTLQSPEDYPPEFDCEWLITVPKGKVVELSFERLDLDFQTSELQVHVGITCRLMMGTPGKVRPWIISVVMQFQSL